MRRFEPVLLEHQPDIIILVGDVNSTVACALVASKIEYHPQPLSTSTREHCSTAHRCTASLQHSITSEPQHRNTPVLQHSKGFRPLIAHVEAGLRSFDRSMPEEINRILTDALSDFLFITEEDARINLLQEGIPKERIHFVGNVMIDTLMSNLEKIVPESSSILREHCCSVHNGYALVTLHRPSNVDVPQNLSGLMDCLNKLSSRIPVVFPIHPRTRSNLERFGICQEVTKNGSIILIPPLGYLEFLGLLKSAALVLTDSGGIQEETTFLKVPCITLRENTERPVTISHGTNYLVGTNPEKIVETAYEILDGKGKKGSIPPLWDGKAGRRIVEILVNRIVTSHKLNDSQQVTGSK